ncbi:MAG: protein translocase subunit SecF [Nitriliruptoraceae bacterium]
MTRRRYRIVPNLGRWLLLSAVLLAVALGGLLGRGLEFSLEFVGGNSFRVEGVPADVDAADLRAAAEAAGATEAVAQLSGEGSDRAGVVRTEALDPAGEVATAVRAALADVAGVDAVEETFVGPSWGERITQQSLRALVVFLVVVAVYIGIRLDRKMAGVALLTLVHDVVLSIGVYALVGLRVSPATVIAFLTILGYSLYDTVVVFDRVRDNLHTLGDPGRRTILELVDDSLSEVIGRSINTTVTSLLPVGALLVIGAGILGATTLQDLALALFIGMAVGGYSSILFAAPIYAHWKAREPAEARRIARVAAKATGDPDAAAAVEASYAGRAPVTTEYVRGEGRRGRRHRR